MEALLRHPEQWSYLREAMVPVTPVAVDGTLIPDLEWRWLSWATRQSERNVDVARRDRLNAITQRSPGAKARFEAVYGQEEVLDRAVEELLRWTAPGTVVPLTASKDMQVNLESAMVVKGCPHAAGDSLTIRRGETIAVAVDELNRRCPVGAGRFDTGEPASLDVSRGDNTSHLSFGLRHSLHRSVSRQGERQARDRRVSFADFRTSSWRGIRFRRRWSFSAGWRVFRFGRAVAYLETGMRVLLAAIGVGAVHRCVQLRGHEERTGDARLPPARPDRQSSVCRAAGRRLLAREREFPAVPTGYRSGHVPVAVEQHERRNRGFDRGTRSGGGHRPDQYYREPDCESSRAGRDGADGRAVERTRSRRGE